MEPDGALLQLDPRAQHSRLRRLHCSRGKGTHVAQTPLWRGHECPTAHPGAVLGANRPKSLCPIVLNRAVRLATTSCSVSSGNTSGWGWWSEFTELPPRPAGAREARTSDALL